MEQKFIRLPWPRERRYYQNLATATTGRIIPVLDGDPSVAPGYTQAKPRPQIFICREFPELTDGLSEIGKYFMTFGVFSHEVLHQVYTDFDAGERFMEKIKSQSEKQIFAMISNILEDPAIEYFAPQVFGGTALRALKYAIHHTWDVSPSIEEADNPFSQYINALIQFGDIGIIKGKFTYPEAEEVFNNTVDLFNRGIVCPYGDERVAISYKIFKASKPLWEDIAKENDEKREAISKALEELLEELSKMGKMPSEGFGSGMDGDEDFTSESGKKKAEAREKLAKSISAGKSKSSDSGFDADSDSDSDSKNSEKSDKKSGSKGKGKDEKEEFSSDSSEDKDGEKDGKTEYSEEDVKSSPNDSAHNSNPMKRQKADGKREVLDYSEANDEESGEESLTEVLLEEDFSISEEEIREIMEEISSMNEFLQKSEDAEKADTDAIPDFESAYSSDIIPKLGKRTCLNRRISDDANDRLEGEYNDAVARMSTGIKSMTVQLKKIFQQDYEEKLHKCSGSLNVKRMSSGRTTARIFDRRRVPEELNDLAIAILVDESGSMHGNRTRAARDCAIALAETFAELKVPCYIMGFTADTEGYDLVHHHYVTWKNTKRDRIKLMKIGAFCQNADGYSIRYITEILRKKQAKHKLLIVISDGQPAAYGYSEKGIEDTKAAIRAAKKHSSVLGVAIDNSDTEIIHEMYQNDFLHVSNVNDLYTQLSKKIMRLVKSWD